MKTKENKEHVNDTKTIDLGEIQESVWLNLVNPKNTKNINIIKHIIKYQILFELMQMPVMPVWESQQQVFNFVLTAMTHLVVLKKSSFVFAALVVSQWQGWKMLPKQKSWQGNLEIKDNCE